VRSKALHRRGMAALTSHTRRKAREAFPLWAPNSHATLPSFQPFSHPLDRPALEDSALEGGYILQAEICPPELESNTIPYKRREENAGGKKLAGG